jgi:hypothetical protein
VDVGQRRQHGVVVEGDVLGQVAVGGVDAVVGALHGGDRRHRHRHATVRQHHGEVHQPAHQGHHHPDPAPPHLPRGVGRQPDGDDEVAGEHQGELDARVPGRDRAGPHLEAGGDERQRREADAGDRAQRRGASVRRSGP